ncbi:peroxiredoxin [Flexibacterium corallicola]|uniref:peroxiredoxin n=1 Tax=Flexibacterium corallicola TaxID=3037259 RepID=UPI00286F36DA|nr:peroxiredoxin [Pseudovibrio sp. M1P-2-3]
MSLHVGEVAPDFTADTTIGTINFHEWKKDSWALFFSHPADFTPVCTTELGRAAQLQEDFKARNVKPIALSTDRIEDHLRWVFDINETQDALVRFPIIADNTMEISRMYDMIHAQESEVKTIRTYMIIDPDNKIRVTCAYPMAVGRSYTEIFRIIDALIVSDMHQVATPVDWEKGDSVIIPPNIDNATARRMFPRGWNEVLPYLRYTRYDQ